MCIIFVNWVWVVHYKVHKKKEKEKKGQVMG